MCIFLIVLGIFYGCLHQGGVVPSLLYLAETSHGSQINNTVLYFNTYMPPRYSFFLDVLITCFFVYRFLLNRRLNARTGIHIVDLGGATSQDLYIKMSKYKNPPWLVCPTHLFQQDVKKEYPTYELIRAFCPHLSMEHVPGTFDSPCLGLYAPAS